jgi:hypothetical protein
LHFAGTNINLDSNDDFITCAHQSCSKKAFYALMHKKEVQLNIMIREIFKKKSAKIHGN